jgi:predicted N-acetyltransferase YhbS
LTENKNYQCRPFNHKDEEEVKQLVKNAFSDFLDGEFWDWKYKLNPNFDPSFVMVAEEDGKIIGCNHWLLRDFKISPSIETKAILGADIAVSPDYRGRGVGKALLLSLRYSETLKNKDPPIIYMFADPNIAKHFHSPTGEYIPAPDKTISYFKILSWKKLKNNAATLNMQIASGKFREKLPNFELKVFFRIYNAPSLYLHMSEKGVEVEERQDFHEKDADVVIVGDLAAFEKVSSKKNRRWNFLRAFFTRELKIRGSVSGFLGFYKCVWMLEEIFSKKVT